MLPDGEFLAVLEEKLAEETAEYCQSKDLEELADVLEVACRIAELKGAGPRELDRIRKDKTQRCGGFERNMLLVDAGAP